MTIATPVFKKKVTYVISNVSKSNVFEWTAVGLKDHVDLTFLLLNDGNSTLENFLIAHGIRTKRIRYRDKRDFFTAGVRVFFYLLTHRPHIVHAHLLDGQLIGLTIARVLGIGRRIYTRHNSTYHHVYHPDGVRLDKWSNRMATDIISISQATDKTLVDLEEVDRKKVTHIPHGFEPDIFSNVSAERVELIKKRWNISGFPVVGVIARQIEWKGIQYIIPAFLEFLHHFPDACLVLANATGPYSDHIKTLLKEIPPRNQVSIPFEEDVAAVYKNFNLYVHTPVDELCEAFGQTYVEALAAGIPSVFTRSGIAAEFVVQDVNAYVAGFRNSQDIFMGLMKIQQNEGYANALRKNGKKDVTDRFRNETTLQLLTGLYYKK